MIPVAQAQAPPKPPAASEEAARKMQASLDELKQLLLEQRKEIESQRALLEAQRDKLERLERLLAERVAPPKEEVRAEDVKLLEGQLEAVATSQSQLAERVTKTEAAVTTAARNAEGRFRQLGNFRLSGDLRFRYENFFQEQQTARQRQRIRARFNLTGNITDELFGGVTFASGSLDDPISTNQTLTAFFNRKQVGFDRFFLEYRPKWLRNHATFGVGKFAYPWIRTSLTFDPDLNPEGIYARFNWDFKNEVFKGLTVVGFHLPFFERGGSTNPATGVRADGLDGFIAGGQVQSRWKLGKRVRMGLHAAGLNFVNVDFIAQAHSNGGLTGNTPNTNSVLTNSSGAVTGYATRFTYLDIINSYSVDTGRPRWPVELTLNFVNNTRARRITSAGVLPNRERSAYFAELQFGRLNERGDMQFGYTFARIERDAVIAAFNESDRRAGSNILQHRLNFSYQFLPNVSANYVLWLGRLANAADNIALVPGGQRAIPGGPCNVAPFSGCTDNYLKRMQLDLIYRF
jgi:hypothetical protein